MNGNSTDTGNSDSTGAACFVAFKDLKLRYYGNVIQYIIWFPNCGSLESVLGPEQGKEPESLARNAGVPKASLPRPSQGFKGYIGVCRAYMECAWRICRPVTSMAN